VFINNIGNCTGWWREHEKLLKNLDKVLTLFYFPEVH
jgi:hypothetical protein